MKSPMEMPSLPAGSPLRQSRGSCSGRLGDDTVPWRSRARIRLRVGADRRPRARPGTGWRDPVRWVLGAMVVGWSVLFIVLGWIRQQRFATFSFDLGIYDQAVWLLSRFHDPFVTVRGLEFFGHHVNPIVLLFVPFYWLGAGPLFLLSAQVVVQASGAVAIFLLARTACRVRPLVAVALAAVLLLNPTLPVAHVGVLPSRAALAIAPLLFAYWAARTERWKLFVLFAVLAAACKEDVALVIAVMGVLIAVPGAPQDRADHAGREHRLVHRRHPGDHPVAERDRAVLRQLLRPANPIEVGTPATWRSCCDRRPSSTASHREMRYVPETFAPGAWCSRAPIADRSGRTPRHARRRRRLTTLAMAKVAEAATSPVVTIDPAIRVPAAWCGGVVARRRPHVACSGGCSTRSTVLTEPWVAPGAQLQQRRRPPVGLCAPTTAPTSRQC